MTTTQSILLIIGFVFTSTAQAVVTYCILRSNDRLWRTNRQLTIENTDLGVAVKHAQTFRDVYAKLTRELEADNAKLRRSLQLAVEFNKDEQAGKGTRVAEDHDHES